MTGQMKNKFILFLGLLLLGLSLRGLLNVWSRPSEVEVGSSRRSSQGVSGTQALGLSARQPAAIRSVSGWGPVAATSGVSSGLKSTDLASLKQVCQSLEYHNKKNIKFSEAQLALLRTTSSDFCSCVAIQLPRSGFNTKSSASTQKPAEFQQSYIQHLNSDRGRRVSDYCHQVAKYENQKRRQGLLISQTAARGSGSKDSVRKVR